MADIYDNCATCGASLSHATGRGKATKYCGPTCKTAALALRREAITRDVCAVPGCGNPATRVKAKLCEAHYHRQRRNGTTDYVGHAILGNLEHTDGYLLSPAPGHPRALGGYRAYQHRVVFHDAHGDGPFACHWCGVQVTWDGMHIDHLNDDKKDNSLSNLVASCPPCNQDRGRWKIICTFRERSGVRIGDRLRTLNEWAAETGVSRTTICRRLSNGWTASDAVLTPARPKRKPERPLPR